MNDKILLGITGGIACGKTTISNKLIEMGLPVIDFDMLSREVVQPNKPAWKKIVREFGINILNADSTINRKKLSEIIFNEDKMRINLEKIVHPFIHNLYLEKLSLLKDDKSKIIQVVVPLANL